MDLLPGSLTLICGANGTGKSTLLSVIAGLTPPSHGERVQRVSTVGLAPEPFHPPVGLRAWELLSLVGGGSSWQSVSTDLNLQALLPRRLTTLSRGELKRVVVAQALLTHPPVVALDEPLEGLDLPSRQRVVDAVQAYVAAGGCAVVASHRPSAWAGASRVDLVEAS